MVVGWAVPKCQREIRAMSGWMKSRNCGLVEVCAPWLPTCSIVVRLWARFPPKICCATWDSVNRDSVAWFDSPARTKT